ncbi:hypothetical protein [Zooshikella ganghwensis]|uniref:Uracil-DNA glycosylase-like domain-containing protein n=1 Tax=Zooshikella ganghwensis TaxID=202772 RepID=A0A4P9VTF6_9GAMM|nr:hypothetical protein [Zooshikella ganghwensis]RDH45714.1 hypothetical protein B9G39_20915 [Zooshikella ganghwensis]
MIEQQRQEYLKAMGITSWYSRYSLAHALPSNPLLWTDVSTPSINQIEADDTKRVDFQEAGSTAATNLPNLHGFLHTPKRSEEKRSLQKQTAVLSQQLKSVINTDESPSSQDLKNNQQVESKNKATDVSSAQPVSSRQPVPTFRLAVCTCQDALIITDLPYSSREGFTKQHQSLLMNILAALNWSVSLKDINIFSWPFTHQQMIDQHRQIALDALSRYLDCHYDYNNHTNILLLGRDAAEFTLNADKPFEQLRGKQKVNNDKQRIVVTYSIDELLKIPQYKRETWADLVTLVAGQ